MDTVDGTKATVSTPKKLPVLWSLSDVKAAVGKVSQKDADGVVMATSATVSQLTPPTETSISSPSIQSAQEDDSAARELSVRPPPKTYDIGPGQRSIARIIVTTRKWRHSRIITGPLERVADALVRAEHYRLPRCLMKIPGMDHIMIDEVLKRVREEAIKLTSVRFGSVLRQTTQEALDKFDWADVVSEWREHAPTFLRFLECASSASFDAPPAPDSSYTKTKKGATVMAGATLLRARVHQMNAMQHHNSLLLRQGGANKRCLARLSRLGCCVYSKRQMAIKKSEIIRNPPINHMGEGQDAEGMLHVQSLTGEQDHSAAGPQQVVQELPPTGATSLEALLGLEEHAGPQQVVQELSASEVTSLEALLGLEEGGADQEHSATGSQPGVQELPPSGATSLEALLGLEVAGGDETENGILLPTLQSALPFLDLHGTPRLDFHQSVFDELRDNLTERVAVIAEGKEEDRFGKLEELLEKSFPLVKMPSIQPVVMQVLKHLPKLKMVMADKELYKVCGVEVKRQIWQDNQALFGDEVSPLLKQYIVEKEGALFSSELSVLHNFFSPSPKARRQGEEHSATGSQPGVQELPPSGATSLEALLGLEVAGGDETENGILLPTLQSALPFLDLHGTPRLDFHQSVFDELRDNLTERVAVIAEGKEEDRFGKLEELLEKSFPLVKMPSIQPVVMQVLKHLPKLKMVMADKELYKVCGVEVKRQIWQDNQALFGDEVSPLLKQYIVEKEGALFSSELSVLHNFFSPSPKARRQGEVVLKLTQMIGKNVKLYDMVLQFLRTLFLRTRNVHYCTLRAELLMSLHDLDISEICSVDPCHKFTWCLDACIREKFVDVKRARELQGFLDGVKKGQEQVLGDLSMILCDPFACNTLVLSTVRNLQELISQDTLPRESSDLLLLLRNAVSGAGRLGHDRQPVVVDDHTFTVEQRLPSEEKSSPVYPTTLPDSFTKYLQGEPLWPVEDGFSTSSSTSPKQRNKNALQRLLPHPGKENVHRHTLRMLLHLHPQGPALPDGDLVKTLEPPKQLTEKLEAQKKSPPEPDEAPPTLDLGLHPVNGSHDDATPTTPV
ncbi:hypothetical protein CRUP_015674 [Coryphaenoides rupestris]|nr:hypothetical protein CRUP_015674 [Coryphaenoides rupestris]